MTMLAIAVGRPVCLFNMYGHINDRQMSSGLYDTCTRNDVLKLAAKT